MERVEEWIVVYLSKGREREEECWVEVIVLW